MKAIPVSLSLCILILLTGCLYPKELRYENQIPPHEYIVVVQNAVDRFYEKTKVLPIKNSDMSTPLYEKYVIDFKRLKEQGYLSLIPPNAFENGGNNLYVLVNVETKPEVKLLDLLSYQQIGELQKKVLEYRTKTKGQLPFGEQIAEHYYWLDYGKLGVREKEILSPYSRQTLHPVIHISGMIALDYAPEIMRIIRQQPDRSMDPEQDLRELLVAESYYVPAPSFPYYWVNDEPRIAE